MNLAQTSDYQPTGKSIVWMVHHLPAWLNPQKAMIHKRDHDFPGRVTECITDSPQTLHEIYSLMPARFRTVQAYRNLETQLKRMTKDGRITRSGRSHSYKYVRN